MKHVIKAANHLTVARIGAVLLIACVLSAAQDLVASVGGAGEPGGKADSAGLPHTASAGMRGTQGIMTRATTITDVLKVQSELTAVRGDIESLTAQRDLAQPEPLLQRRHLLEPHERQPCRRRLAHPRREHSGHNRRDRSGHPNTR